LSFMTSLFCCGVGEDEEHGLVEDEVEDLFGCLMDEPVG